MQPGRVIRFVYTVDSDVVNRFASLVLSEWWSALTVGRRYRVFPLMLSLPSSVHSSVPIPSFYRLWYGATLPGMREDNSLVSVTEHSGLTDTLVVPTSDPKVLCSTHSLRICNFLNGSLFWCTAKTIDWLQFFSSGKKSLETLSPTQTAPYQHICTTEMQTTIWSQTTSDHMDITDFQEWGWYSSGRWLRYWTALEDISKACSIQLQCGCMK
jgi:hypothetical protein